MKHDQVMSDLGRHLSDLDRQEAKERALDSWLETATPNDMIELFRRMDSGTEYRFCSRLLMLLTEMDTLFGSEQIKGLIGEFLQKEDRTHT